ncbi:MAG: cytochrome P460 family protein [Planctomycetia bacterium]|nr:cytochrome P460 family protein [Planctomycetia bacterium]
MKKAMLVAAFAVVALFTLGLCYPAPKGDAQSGRPKATQAHYERLWAWLKQSDYTKWNAPNGKAPDFQEGHSPHGALIKTYLSERAAKDRKDLADGSVIVKENYGPDKKLMAITVMHRSKGYDAKNGDWYYAKYMPDGKIDVTPPEMKSMPVAGKFKMCIECHSGAAGGDFLFFND